MADSCWCLAETNAILKAISFQLKVNKIFFLKNYMSKPYDSILDQAALTNSLTNKKHDKTGNKQDCFTGRMITRTWVHSPFHSDVLVLPLVMVPRGWNSKHHSCQTTSREEGHCILVSVLACFLLFSFWVKETFPRSSPVDWPLSSIGQEWVICPLPNQRR